MNYNCLVSVNREKSDCRQSKSTVILTVHNPQLPDNHLSRFCRRILISKFWVEKLEVDGQLDTDERRQQESEAASYKSFFSALTVATCLLDKAVEDKRFYSPSKTFDEALCMSNNPSARAYDVPTSLTVTDYKRAIVRVQSVHACVYSVHATVSKRANEVKHRATESFTARSKRRMTFVTLKFQALL